MTKARAVIIVSLTVLITGCHRPEVKLAEMFSPPSATVTDHTVTIRLENYLGPRKWVHTRTEIQGQTIYLYGYRTYWEQNDKHVVRLPSSMNPQSVSVVWLDPDGSRLRIPMTDDLSMGSAYHRFYDNYRATYRDSPPMFFWCGPGPTNGQIVLRGFRAGDSKSKADARALIGSSVVFDGEGYDRSGPNLETDDGINIAVDLVPYQVVGPGSCGKWGVEVKGTLESVDFSNRVVPIEARPEHWMVTWQL